MALKLPTGSGIIYRHFGAKDRFAVAASLADLARRRGLKLLIAADPRLAAEVGAHGVHWPEARLREAFKWHGRFRLQTASAHSRFAIVLAERMGIDAALVSTVFPSKSLSASRSIGSLRLRRLAQSNGLPLYALGGVNYDNALRVAGASGLAAIEGLS